MIDLDKTRYYRKLFLIGAIWNWFVAILLLLISLFMIDLAASLLGMEIPPSLIWIHLIIGLIFAYGVGYYIIARDLTKNHGLVIIGIMEKYLFFIIFLIYYIFGDININAVLLVVPDFIFGCLYLEFIFDYKKIQKEKIS
ncbi:MAG TPA: hypothetical protein VMV49_03015 [Candidatus Deferrimicrobium sp.]|nr:hypothetical protein [Candidatus Deferrimicrobium sp.]